MSLTIVDLQRLQELRRQCSVLNDAFASRDHTIDSYADDIGSPRLTNTIRNFESHWNDGHSKIRNHLDAMLARLDTAIAAYRDCETALIEQVRASR